MLLRICVFLSVCLLSVFIFTLGSCFGMGDHYLLFSSLIFPGLYHQECLYFILCAKNYLKGVSCRAGCSCLVVVQVLFWRQLRGIVWKSMVELVGLVH